MVLVSKTLGFWTYDTQHKIVMQIIMDRNAQCWFFFFRFTVELLYILLKNI